MPARRSTSGLGSSHGISMSLKDGNDVKGKKNSLESAKKSLRSSFSRSQSGKLKVKATEIIENNAVSDIRKTSNESAPEDDNRTDNIIEKMEYASIDESVNIKYHEKSDGSIGSADGEHNGRIAMGMDGDSQQNGVNSSHTTSIIESSTHLEIESESVHPSAALASIILFSMMDDVQL